MDFNQKLIEFIETKERYAFGFHFNMNFRKPWIGYEQLRFISNPIHWNGDSWIYNIETRMKAIRFS